MKQTYVADGRLRNGTWTIVLTDAHKSNKLTGYRLPESTIDELIEHDVEYIVFVDLNRGRYTISLEDWLDCRVWAEGDHWQHVSQSRFDRG